MRTLRLEPVTADFAGAAPTKKLAPYEPANPIPNHPDAHWVAIEDGVVVGRCSLWVSNTPPLSGEVTGVIGHYDAEDDEIGSALLIHACRELAADGCTLAVGPMDGNTWRRYRFITDRGDRPQFLLEPDNPDEYPHHFAAADFTPLAGYTSAITDNLTYDDRRLGRVADRLASDRIAIRHLDRSTFEQDLGRIFDLSLVSFRNNFLYTPIGEAEFVDSYKKVLPYIVPELVLLAEDGAELAGFLFTTPDYAQKGRGEPMDTVVLKTLAVAPGRRYAGLGALLTQINMHTAAKLGYRNAIHALMHDSNTSRKISDHMAATFRRYTLYAKRLRR